MRKRLPIGTRVLLVAGVAAMALGGVYGAATAAPQVAPKNTEPPEIVGTARDGETLVAKDGDWTGANVTFAYQWRRCDTAGLACGDIAGATAKTYRVHRDDVGKTLRVKVTATNADGSSSAESKPTGVVAAPAGATPTASGATSIPATSVAMPDRLIVAEIQFNPPVVRSRDPFTARIRVNDTRGYLVRDAIVYVTGVPWSRIQQPAEVKTGVDGWATIQIQPTAQLPLKRGYFLVMFVRARKEGDNVLAGVSSRRLVQLRLGPPAAA